MEQLIENIDRLFEKSSMGKWVVSAMGDGTSICAAEIPAACDPSSRQVVAECSTMTDGRVFESAWKQANADANLIVMLHNNWPKIRDAINGTLCR